MAGDSIDRGYGFPSTHWSLVARAGGEFDEAQRAALNQLLRRYWPALKAHLVVKQRIDSNEADDLVQSFIESKVLERDLIESADSSRGRFRNLLARALSNFVAGQMERRSAKKRRIDRAVPVDFQQYTPFAASISDPDRAFDLEWARRVLSEALSRMRAECVASGREDLWGVFQQRIAAPILDGTDPVSYEALIDRFGFKSPSQASNVLVTAKRTFVRALRAVIGEYAADEGEIEEEIRDLQEIFAAASHQAAAPRERAASQSEDDRDGD